MTDDLWEDSLLEKKLESDTKDILKTIVGFANSVRPDHKAVLLIGEADDGRVQGVTNPDNMQKRVRTECDKIYPAVLYRQTVYQKDDKFCVRVEVEYSGQTPHFGGSAWVRSGSETIKATDVVFQRLINLRQSKVFELEKWHGRRVTVISNRHQDENVHFGSLFHGRATSTSFQVEILEVNNFWVTFVSFEIGKKDFTASEPIEKLLLSYDNHKERLKIILI